MIRSRRYVVPLTAVLLALATGVALGAGPLSGAGSSASPAPRVVTRAPAPGFSDAFAASVAPRLYAHALAGRPVAIVTMPGADPATVSALSAQVRAASGRVTGTYAVAGQLVAAQQKNLVDTLGIQLAAPVIVFSLVFNLATGLVGRVMPAFQIFFVTSPLSVILGLSLLALSLGGIAMVWTDRYRELLEIFS